MQKQSWMFLHNFKLPNLPEKLQRQQSRNLYREIIHRWIQGLQLVQMNAKNTFFFFSGDTNKTF